METTSSRCVRLRKLLAAVFGNDRPQSRKAARSSGCISAMVVQGRPFRFGAHRYAKLHAGKKLTAFLTRMGDTGIRSGFDPNSFRHRRVQSKQPELQL